MSSYISVVTAISGGTVDAEERATKKMTTLLRNLLAAECALRLRFSVTSTALASPNERYPNTAMATYTRNMMRKEQSSMGSKSCSMFTVSDTSRY